MIELIENKQEWVAVIESALESDFYQSYDYHALSKNKNEHPILIKYRDECASIAIPLLIRKIEGTPYRDATSVYGYSGPFTSNICPGYDNSVFARKLTELFLDHRIVSVFSRLNPFVPHQKKVLKGLGTTSSPGNVVYIDLKKDPEEQLSAYSKRLKTYINKSRRLYTIKKATERDEIMQFIALYYENMRRVQAREHYFFKETYFFDLLASKDFKAEILLAMDNQSGCIIGGALFLKHKRIVQYHLSGAREEFLKLNPIKLLIDEMRERAIKEGYYYFNLGGGVGNKEDSLFHFKSGFSGVSRPFELWKFIVNENAYRELVRGKRNINGASNLVECGEFFPIYRCDQLQ
jgi:lipid II:glycine glycyltransferase (peptidoglycan interpeptide bridge formation enzyme)